MDYVLSLSYGKDSLACLGAIEELGWPLDRIVHAEVWATDTIPADLPPMVEFKAKADRIIKERWGLEVQHIRTKQTAESVFYADIKRVETWTNKILDVKRMCLAWMKKDGERAKKILAEKDREKMTVIIALVRDIMAEEEAGKTKMDTARRQP